ncbi:hypothetical protein [Roseibium aestuarii]|uniref:Uncharacterized protein n=1 Tax=Roseibium aestuarii TaxID=2600299 RepID=A0ABW4JUM2_9HYPH|nr:hypothetical protein [Roseibium aestuarii]
MADTTGFTQIASTGRDPMRSSWRRALCLSLLLALSPLSPLSGLAASSPAQAATREDLPVEAVTPPAASAESLSDDPLPALLSAMTPDQRDEFFIFLAGNAYVALHDRLAEAVLQRLGLEKGPSPQTTLDALSAIQMSALAEDEAALYLSTGLIGAVALGHMASSPATELSALPARSDLANRLLLCSQLDPDDPAGFAALAEGLGYPEEDLETCAPRLNAAFDTWHDLTFGLRPEAVPDRVPVAVIHEDAATDPLRLFLKESHLLELVASQMNQLYGFTRPLTLAARNCTTPAIAWDDARSEVTLCDGLLRGYGALFLEIFPATYDGEGDGESYNEDEDAAAPDARGAQGN